MNWRRLHVDTRPLRRRDFRNLWLGQMVSTIGAEIAVIAVPYQVYTRTGSTALVGLLGLASLVPLLFVPLVGGAFADALDRRTVVLVTETGLAAVAVLFLVNALLPTPQVWALFVLQGLAVAVYSFGRPALASLAPRLVPDEELAAANSLSSVYGSLSSVAGPAVGGVVIATAGVPWTFGIDAATYAASLLVIWWLPKLPPLEDVNRPSFRSIVDGFRFLKGRQALIGIFAIDTNAMVFGMPSALFPAIALHRLHGTASTVGYLYAAPYAGALFCSLLSGWCSHVRRMGLAITIMACLWGAAIAGFGLTTSLVPALALLAVAGGGDFYSAVLRGTMLLRSTPDHLRGRMLGIEFMQVASAPNLGDLEAGVLASLTSLRFSIVSGGLACIAGCVVTALALPKFLNYDAGPDTQPT
uniref:Integral membrane protein n=1 Tax=uncultured bacterium 5G12 TaxID=1701325 RepID=A0A0N9HTT5_9BACT|nr:integral membrane protein [uncultured bacterium 5G12]